jgi:hypothetical protein
MVSQIEQKKHGLLSTLLLLITILTYAVTTISTSAVTLDTNYEVVLVSHVGNTWTYNVSCNGSPAISHWILAFCGGSEAIVSTDPEGVYGKDPTTGLYGIKWDIGIDPGEYALFVIVLDADYPEGLVPVAIKAGPNEYIGLIEGPLAWDYQVDIDAVATSYGVSAPWFDYQMAATATSDNTAIVQVTFSWYGPFTTEPLALTHVTDYVGDDIDPTGSSPFESIYPKPNICVAPNPRDPWVVHENDMGWWYVEAKFYILPDETKPDELFLCGFAYDTYDPTNEVPWFTSLPIALLATVGLVFLLRRKGSVPLTI